MIQISSDAFSEAARAVRATLGELATPIAAIVLGSGLGGVADTLSDARRIPYSGIPRFPSTTVAGHRGELVSGSWDGAQLLLFAGRLHAYEGYAAADVAFPVRLAHALGARTLLVTNAAGGIRRTFRPGDIMVIRDQIAFAQRSPLVGRERDGEPRTPEMVDAYDPGLARLLVGSGRAARVPVVEGVYAGVVGPSYETPTEIRMLERMGADAVAMSIIQEVITARALGMRVGGLSCIANAAAGITGVPLDHSEVLRAGTSAAERVGNILRETVKSLASARQSGERL